MSDKRQAWMAEPWEHYDCSALKVDDEGREWLIAEASSDIAYGTPDSNAARIVQCVNAMAGIPDPAEWRRRVVAVVEADHRIQFLALSGYIDARDTEAAQALADHHEAIAALLALDPTHE